ncbi:MAG: hypothetical protein NTX44_12340 [Ignavibacteriales bacterium]|nr:hypothetical protein [Ignavibacteriales bacterium]
MRVIVKRLSMETTQEKYSHSRRSFFVRLFSGIAGGWIVGNLFSSLVRSTTGTGSKRVVQAKINPLAVQRTNKDSISHGA